MYTHTQVTELLPNALVIGGILVIYIYTWRKTALISIVLTSLVVPPSLYILSTHGEVGYFLCLLSPYLVLCFCFE
jgi:hypothetical protein